MTKMHCKDYLIYYFLFLFNISTLSIVFKIKLLQTKILVMGLWTLTYCWDLSNVKYFKMQNDLGNHVTCFQRDKLLGILQFPRLF